MTAVTRVLPLRLRDIPVRGFVVGFGPVSSMAVTVTPVHEEVHRQTHTQEQHQREDSVHGRTLVQ